MPVENQSKTQSRKSLLQDTSSPIRDLTSRRSPRKELDASLIKTQPINIEIPSVNINAENSTTIQNDDVIPLQASTEPSIKPDKRNSFLTSLSKMPFDNVNRTEVQENELVSDIQEIRRQSDPDSVDVRPNRVTRQVSGRSIHKASSNEPEIDYNDDFCSTCFLKGELLCCESCPKSFHPVCTEEAFGLDDLPEGFWECKRCRSAASLKKPKFESESTPRKRKIFSSLLNDMDRRNPAIFSLPKSLTGMFEHTWMHPRTGEFVDKRTTEIKPITLRTNAIRRTKPIRNISDINYSETEGMKYDSKIDTCFQCSKTGYSFQPTSILLSHSVPQPLKSNGRFKTQTIRSELIKCDYCDLCWHLDCLNPPLAAIPPELREASAEYVDLVSIKSEMRKWTAKVREIEALIDQGIIGYELRKKWRCPCHANYLTEDLSSALCEKLENTFIENTVETMKAFSKKETVKEADIISGFVSNLGTNQRETLLNSDWIKSNIPLGIGQQYTCELTQLYNFVNENYSKCPSIPKDIAFIEDLIHASDIIKKFEEQSEYLYSKDDITECLENSQASDSNNALEILKDFKDLSPHSKSVLLKSMVSLLYFDNVSHFLGTLNMICKYDFVSLLPSEICFTIFGYLDAKTLCNAAMVSKKWNKLADEDRLWYRLCRQHIDRKCTKCGWGLPLMIRKRKVESNETRAENDKDGYNVISKSWKGIYCERLIVERNWRGGNYSKLEIKAHEKMILCLQLHERMGIIVSGSQDCTIGVWKIVNGACSNVLRGHTNAVTCLQFDSSKLISGSLDGTVRIWSMESWKCMRVWRLNPLGITSLTFNERKLATGGPDGRIIISNIADKVCYDLIGHQNRINKLQITGKYLFSSADDCSLRLWNLEDRNLLKVFSGHSHPVTSFHLTIPHDHEVLDLDVGNWSLVSSSADNTLKKWNISNGEPISTIYGHTDSVNGICCSSLRFISCSADGSVRVWDDGEKFMYSLHSDNIPFTCCDMADTKVCAGRNDGSLIIWGFN